MFFKSVMQTPPNGEWVFEHEGERISDVSWPRFHSKLMDLMMRHRIHGLPRDIAAEYMCPFLPEWFCTSGGVKVTGSDVARANAKPYFSKHLVSYDEMIARQEVCRNCPKHSRNVCLTCTGILNWIVNSFGGRRKQIPDDRMSGMCACAKTFAAVVTSVDARELPEWEDVPDNCWRKRHEHET